VVLFSSLPCPVVYMCVSALFSDGGLCSVCVGVLVGVSLDVCLLSGWCSYLSVVLLYVEVGIEERVGTLLLCVEVEVEVEVVERGEGCIVWVVSLRPLVVSREMTSAGVV
jgi:hypothetical protein